MFHSNGRNRFGFAVRLLSAFLVFSFLSTTILPPGYAQSIGLPLPGTMVNTSPAFVPVLLKGMTVHPDNPLQFDFILDSGNASPDQDEVRGESERLVKYFLASMTVPHNDLWVNLSPYEKDRIIPEELGRTELGRDLLAQDYILKQLTATLVYPENELGKKFWDRIHKTAKERYGLDSVPTDVFNKVWILPETAVVYEHKNTVYIVDTHLKVMLDEDYAAMQESLNGSVEGTSVQGAPQSASPSEVSALTKQLIRELILPEIEHEVNQGKNFAPLRQIYHSLILAKWYKQTVKNSLMSQVYIDQNKTAGIEIDDKEMKDRIYEQYMEAYKQGVFNYIKEDYDELSKTVIPRQYFSGGFKDAAIEIGTTENAAKVRSSVVGKNLKLALEVKPEGGSAANASVVPEGERFEGSILASGINGPREIKYSDIRFLTPEEMEENEVDLKKLNELVRGVLPNVRSIIVGISSQLPGDLAVYKKTSKEIEYVLNEKLAKELLSVHNNKQPDRAKNILTRLLSREESRRPTDNFYDMYAEEYRLIKEDLAYYKKLKDPQRYYTDEYFNLLKTLEEDLTIITNFDKVLSIVTELEAKANDVYRMRNKSDHYIGNQDIKEVIGEVYKEETAVGQDRLKDPTYLRNRRINKAYTTADGDYFGRNLVKILKGDKRIKGTFLASLIEILIHRGAAQGRESFLFLADKPVNRIPFSQLKVLPMMGLEDKDDFTAPKRQYYAFHAGRRFSDGLGVTEAENPEGTQQKWHVHETNQEFTVSLSDNTQLRYAHGATPEESDQILEWEKEKGPVPVYKTETDEQEIFINGEKKTVAKIKITEGATDVERHIVIDHEEAVPFGYMIVMPKAKFHTLKNTSRKQKGIDFTIKDPVTQLIKTFSPPDEVNVDRPVIIAPNFSSSDKEWGVISEHPYLNPYNLRMKIDDQGRMGYAFNSDGNPLPIMGDPAYLKLRIVEVKPGQSTDFFDFHPLDQMDKQQIIRIFPWPRSLPEATGNKETDWYLYRDYKNLKAEVVVFKKDGAEYQRVTAEGGDLVLLDNNKAEGEIAGFKVKNNSTDNTLVFYVLEPSDAVARLLPFFHGSLEALSQQISSWQEQYKEVRIAVPSISQILSKEFFKITDEQGNYTGEVMPRELVHAKIANGQAVWHRTAGAFIVDRNGNILFQVRGEKKKTKPGAYDVAAGGHMGLDEPASGMLREIEEEVFDSSYNIDPSRFFALTKDGEFVRNEDGKENASFFIYFIESNEKDKIKKQDAEVGKLEWVGGEALGGLIQGYKGYVESSPDPYAAGFIFFEHAALKKRLLTFVASLAKGDSLESAVVQADLTKTDLNSAILADNAETVVLEQLQGVAKFIPSLEQRVRQEIGKIDRVGHEFVINEKNGDDSIEAVGEMREEGLFLSYTYSYDRVKPNESIRSTHVIFVPRIGQQAEALGALSQKILKGLAQRGVLLKSIKEEDLDGFVKLGISQAKEALGVARQRAEVQVDTGDRRQEILDLSFENKENGLQVTYELGGQKGSFVEAVATTGATNASVLSGSRILSRPWTLNGARKVLDGVVYYGNYDGEIAQQIEKAIRLIGESEKNNNDIERLISILSANHKYSEEQIELAESYLTKEQAIEGYVRVLLGKNKKNFLDVRVKSAEALGRLGGDRAVRALIEALSSDLPDLLKSIVKALGGLGDKRAVDPLIKRLSEESPDVREFVEEALGNLGATQEQMVNGYLNALQSPSGSAQKNAVQALGSLGATQEQMVNGYLNALQSSSDFARKNAAQALGNLGDKRAVDPLIKRLSEEGVPYVRRSVVEALGKLGVTQEQLVNVYLNALQSPDYLVRGTVALELGKLGDERAVDPLIKKLSEEESYVRKYVAEALGDLGDKRAVDPLIKRLSEEWSYMVRESVVAALGKLGDMRAVDLLIKRLSEESSYIVREYVVAALGKLGDKRAVDPLIEKLSENSSYVRQSVVAALGKLGDKRAIEPLVKTLSISKYSGTSYYFTVSVILELLKANDDQIEMAKKIVGEQKSGEAADSDGYDFDDYPRGTDFAPRKGASRTYAQLEGSFIDDLEVGFDLSKDGAERIFQVGKGSSEFSDLLNNTLTSLGSRILSSSNPDLIGYWNELLTRGDNRSNQIAVRVSDKMLVNSSRYFNAEKGGVEIVFSKDFVDAMIAQQKTHSQAVQIILSERLFHELGHSNHSDHLGREEAALIEQDLSLYKILIDSGAEEEVSAFYQAVKPLYRSGYYFSFLRSRIPMDIESARKNIQSYVEENVNSAVMGGPWTLNGARKILKNVNFIQSEKISNRVIRAINLIGKQKEYTNEVVIHFFEVVDINLVEGEDLKLLKKILSSVIDDAYVSDIENTIKQYLTKRDLVDAYIEALGSSKPSVVARAAIKLGELRDERAIEPLLNALAMHALPQTESALGKFGVDKAVINSKILSVVTDNTRRRDAINEILKTHDKQAIQTLDEILSNERTIQSAAEFLRKGLFVIEANKALEVLNADRAVIINANVAALSLFEEKLNNDRSGFGPSREYNNASYMLHKYGDPRGSYMYTALTHEETVYDDWVAGGAYKATVFDGWSKEKWTDAALQSHQQNQQTNASILNDKDVGGIDMNTIELDRQGEGEGIRFDMTGIEPLLNMDIQGFTPVIIDITPISSVLPILGLADPREPAIKFGTEEAQEALQLS